MTKIKLSFCIPTYNRADYLGQTLTNIARQILDNNFAEMIEICVSDNASVDHTDVIIGTFNQDFPSVRLVYSKNTRNLGADRNFLRVVELAVGDYCWLLGSDDCLATNALAKLFQQLTPQLDIVLCNRTNCSFELDPIESIYWLKSKRSRIFDFSRAEQVLEYFNLATSLGAVFSYLSTIIVRRSAWNNIIYDENMTGTAYSHVFKLLSIVVNTDARLMYLAEPLILCRSGNDSFATEGDFKRFALDIVGYAKLAEIIKLPAQKRAFFRIMTREHPWYRLAKMKYIDGVGWKELKPHLAKYRYNIVGLALANFLSVLPFIVPIAVKMKKKLA